MADYSISNLDALDWMRDFPDGSVDLIITDPPYESMEKHRKIGTTTRLKKSKASSNQWFEIFPDTRFPEFFAEAYRVLRKHRHLYLFCNSDTMFVVKPMAEAAGFKFWKPIVWDKVKIGMGYHYRARYEFILFFEKGKRKLTNLGTPDILTAPRIYRGYPTEKPPEIAETLVTQSTAEGELVIDPFMGAGSSGIASLQHRRNFHGNDKCLEAAEISRGRFEALEATDQVAFPHRQEVEHSVPGEGADSMAQLQLGI